MYMINFIISLVDKKESSLFKYIIDRTIWAIMLFQAAFTIGSVRKIELGIIALSIESIIILFFKKLIWSYKI